MAKVNLLDIQNFTNLISSANTLNRNNSTIEAAFENTLSRDGSSPNTMRAQIDMNSNKIVNLTDGTNDQDAATFGQVTTVNTEAAASAAAAAASALAAASSAAAAASDAISTAADVVTTNADVVLTNADVVSTNADVVTTAASASAAATSESNASTYASNASTSASNASTSETNAATSETNAATSETNAATSASNASTSETNAATSETNAAASEAAAAASADAVDDLYLGSKASAPTLDNDGDPLADGALYFNTTANEMNVYDLGTTTWLSIDGTMGGTAGTTDNAVPRADGTGGNTLQASGVTIDDSDNVAGVGSITAGSVLASSDDSGAIGASGTAFSDLFLASGAVIDFNASDVKITHSANALTFSGGDYNFTGYGLFQRSGTPIFSINLSDSASAKLLEMRGNRSATAADNDEIYISSYLYHDGAATSAALHEFARLNVVALDVSENSEDGAFQWSVATAGSLQDTLQLSGAALHPVTNDLVALGTTSLGFSDLFLASGGVINFNNGDVLITHSANNLDVTGGELQVGGSNVLVDTDIGSTVQAYSADNVVKTGTPVDNQIAIFTDANTVEGVAGFTYEPNEGSIQSVKSTPDDYWQGFTVLNSGMTTGQATQFLFGQSNSSGNCCEFNYFHSTVGGDRYFDLGFFARRGFSMDFSGRAKIYGGLLVDSTESGAPPASGPYTGLTVGAGDFKVTAGDILLGSNDAGALGANGTAWSDLYLASGSIISFNSGDVTITHSANTLTQSGGNFVLQNGYIQAYNNSAAAPGIYADNITDNASVKAIEFRQFGRSTAVNNDEVYASFMLKDSAGNIDEMARITTSAWDVTTTSEDSTLIFSTMSAGTLTAACYVADDGSIRPSTDDRGALGSASTKWSDLYLASGGVINFSGGDVSITHSAGKLTIDDNVVIEGINIDGSGVGFYNEWVLYTGTGLSGSHPGLRMSNTADIMWNSAGGYLTAPDTYITPTASGTVALSTDGASQDGTFQALNIDLGSGAVIDFNSGDVTLTHSANALAIAGLTALTVGNYVFNVDQTVGVGQDNYVLTYDDASGEIGLESAVGGGNVSNTGTPADNQIAVWTAATTIEGDGDFTWDGNRLEIESDTGATAATESTYATAWHAAGASSYLAIGQASNQALLQSWSGNPLVINGQGNRVIVGSSTAGGSLHIYEKASAGGDSAGESQIWAKSTTPSQLWHTDDAGNDYEIGKPGLVLLTGGDHSGAASFDVDISSYTSRFDVFKIVITNGDVVTDSDYIGLQLFTDGGTTPISAGYAYATEGNDDAGSDHGDNSGSDSQMKITDSVGNDAGQMWSAEFNLYNCSSSAEVKTIGGQSSFFDGGIDWTVYNFTGALPGTTAVITDFRILTVGGPGNFSCRYDVYGLAQS